MFLARFTREQFGGEWVSSWEVGYYDPSGEWQCYEDFETQARALAFVNYLNGGTGAKWVGFDDEV